MDDPDDDTVLTPHRPRVVRPGLDTEDTIVREWVPPPVRHPAVADVLEAIDRARTVGSADTQPIEPEPEVATSAWYRFRIGESGEPVQLDVPAYIGRRPSSPRIQSGVLPRLLSVPSPQQEVSSTHVEIRQLGSTIIVSDMKSTNGSLVIAPGDAPRKLRQGESVVVSPGTLVDIGDGNLIEILPMQRLTHN